jgi:DNA-binding IclR family transcriptional regulator
MSVRTGSSRERLGNLLDRLNPGDEIRVAAASRETGLDLITCRLILEGLTRADLFTQKPNGAFVRRRMFDALDQLDA